MNWIAEASPRFKARTAGLFYLLIFIAAPSGAASATPIKMIITLICDSAVVVIFYDLFKPVSRGFSLLAALFRLIFVTVMAANSLSYFGVIVSKHAHSAAAFESGYGLALVPFGIHCLLIGCLIFKSTFLPRIFGILMVMAGLGYLTFLWPRLGGELLFPYSLIPGGVGEGLLTLWLLVMGLNVQRWKEQAALATGAARIG